MYSVVLAITLLLLFAIIILSALKLSIYFNSFMFLSKPVNYDKVNYISNSCFFQYFYTNRLLNGSFDIERVITFLFVVLAIIALIGNLFFRHMNYGFLSYYYGDPQEYLYVNLFIYIIIIMALFYAGSYMMWYNNGMAEDNLLETNEARLKDFFADNLDYNILYDYYILTQNDVSKVDRIAEKILTIDKENLFKIFFTYHILKDGRFSLIKKRILKLIADTGADALEKNREDSISKIKVAIKDDKAFYIIANYNHNNSVALPQFEVMVDIFRKDDYLSAAPRATINEIYDKIGDGTDVDIIRAVKLYESAQEIFMDTIKTYKTIYDKYYSYYMWSVLLTNFLIIYAILIFVYIIIKILAKHERFDDTQYNVYYLRADLNAYGIYIIPLYYLITSPIIIFGFN